LRKYFIAHIRFYLPATWEAEAGEWRVQGGFEKHSETLSKKKKVMHPE
jgi:hypothetical protein